MKVLKPAARRPAHSGAVNISGAWQYPRVRREATGTKPPQGQQATLWNSLCGTFEILRF